MSKDGDKLTDILSNTEMKRLDAVWELFINEIVFLSEQLMVLKHVSIPYSIEPDSMSTVNPNHPISEGLFQTMGLPSSFSTLLLNRGQKLNSESCRSMTSLPIQPWSDIASPKSEWINLLAWQAYSSNWSSSMPHKCRCRALQLKLQKINIHLHVFLVCNIFQRISCIGNDF